jgi:hyperosmotically inducible periplasmic protein
MNAKKVIPALAVVVLAMAGCTTAKTSSDAPNSTSSQVDSPTVDSAKTTEKDATSDVRRNQLNSDIRAKEQRNNTFNNGQASNRSSEDLASEVRAKLEANLPASALTVTAKDGVVNIAGSVPTKAQYDRISSLAKGIKGVTSVNMKVAIAPAKSN